MRISEIITEVSPKGWEGTVKAMKKHKEIDNPWALAWYMKNKGYKSHKKEALEEDRDWTKTSGKMHPDAISTLPSAHLVSGTADRVYDLYRLGMKAAEADGITPVKNSGESWVGRNNLISPYTKHELDMLKDAYKANGLAWTDKLNPNPENKSREPENTNKTSTTLNSDWKKKQRHKNK
jgi:hypothetical protein